LLEDIEIVEEESILVKLVSNKLQFPKNERPHNVSERGRTATRTKLYKLTRDNYTGSETFEDDTLTEKMKVIEKLILSNIGKKPKFTKVTA